MTLTVERRIDFEKKILKVLITFYLPFDDDDACLCV
jgi:hypothetical protein